MPPAPTCALRRPRHAALGHHGPQVVAAPGCLSCLRQLHIAVHVLVGHAGCLFGGPQGPLQLPQLSRAEGNGGGSDGSAVAHSTQPSGAICASPSAPGPASCPPHALSRVRVQLTPCAPSNWPPHGPPLCSDSAAELVGERLGRPGLRTCTAAALLCCAAAGRWHHGAAGQHRFLSTESAKMLQGSNQLKQGSKRQWVSKRRSGRGEV